MIFANISAVGSSALARELMMLSPCDINGAIVTPAVPGGAGYLSLVFEYKSALANTCRAKLRSTPRSTATLSATVLIQGFKRVGPTFDIDRLAELLENKRNIDLGLGTQLSYGSAEHRGSHEIWGTARDEAGIFQPIEIA